MITLTDRIDNALDSSYVILIVDDSEVDRETYRHYLSSAAHLNNGHIVDCESAQSALDLCQRICPDVILLNYFLPDANGLELLNDLTQQLAIMPPVIMMADQGNETVAINVMKYGAKDYLIKGEMTSQSLIDSVTCVLNEHHLQTRLDRQQKQRDLLRNVAFKISCAQEVPNILQAAVQGVRELLDCDRAIIYRLTQDMSGCIVAESVSPGWISILNRSIENQTLVCEQAHQLKHYRQNEKRVIPDLEAALDLSDWQVRLYEQFQVKAALMAPILCRDVLANQEPPTQEPPTQEPLVWGLLAAHHCNTTHDWQADELELLDELSMQMAIAIQQAELMADLKRSLDERHLIEDQLRDRATEIAQTNLRLSRASRFLKKRNQQLNDFSHNVSHDLKAPLRGIGNLTQWLIQDLENTLPVENRQQLELIQSRVLQMNTLIDGLLEYARVGKENIDPAPVDLSQLLHEVVELLMPPNCVQVKFRADLPTIETKVLLLKQVLCNLIGNALKYHDRPDGQVEILVEERAKLWQFTVVDDGPGIAPEQHAKIFGMFQTLLRPDLLKSTGIGLAIVKKIVEDEGGSVWVKSAIGEGSAFSFTWPK